jgi:hypothetical protein
MPTINQLPLLAQLSSGDQLPVYSPVNGDARRVSIASLIEYFQANFADPDYLTIINAPTNSGFNIQIGAQTKNVFLIINPTGSFAAGTITLPPVASCFDGQEIVVACSQVINALTITPNGATVIGAPSLFSAGGFFALRFNVLQAAWYTVSANQASTFTSITLTSGINDVNGNELVRVSATASAVNEITVANAAAGAAPAISATGNDTNISLNLAGKGTGGVQAGGIPVVTETAGQTLTNKTLTAPIISTISNTGTLTLPTSTDTLVGRATTDTLTNKTLTAPITTGLRRAAPVTKTADFTLADAEDYLINNKAGSACVVTLPTAGSYTGRGVTIKTIQAQAVNSASSNVVPRAGGAAGTAILTGTAGNWATLVSDGSNWVIMAGS